MTVGQIVLIGGSGIGLLFCLAYLGLKYGSNTNIETNARSAPAAPVAPACDVNAQLQLSKEPSYSEKEGVVTVCNEKQHFLMKQEKEGEKGESHPLPAFTN